MYILSCSVHSNTILSYTVHRYGIQSCTVIQFTSTLHTSQEYGKKLFRHNIIEQTLVEQHSNTIHSEINMQYINTVHSVCTHLAVSIWRELGVTCLGFQAVPANRILSGSLNQFIFSYIPRFCHNSVSCCIPGRL